MKKNLEFVNENICRNPEKNTWIPFVHYRNEF